MVKIRLARRGSKKSPFYHINISDSRSPRDGRYVERIGFFNPIPQGQAVRLELDIEKYQAWIKKGAQPSDRVETLYREALAISQGKAPKAKPAKAPKAAKAAPKAEAKTEAEAPKAAEAVEATPAEAEKAPKAEATSNEEA